MSTTCITFLAALVAAQANQTTVEGDRELLDEIVAAQRTHLADYPQGRIECEATSFEQWFMPPQTLDAKANVNYRWIEGHAFWRIAGESRLTGRPGAEMTDAYMIETPHWWATYSPRANLLRIHHGRYTEFGFSVLGLSNLHVRPDLSWSTIAVSRTWADLFDPKWVPPVADVTRILSAERMPDDRAIVTIIHEGGAIGRAELRAEIWLAAGSNIVGYKSPNPPPDGVSESGMFEWGHDGQDRWQLRRRESTRIVHRDGKPASELRFELRVIGFDPDDVPSPETFEVSAFPLVEGTQVEEFDAKKKERDYVLGDAAKQGQVLNEAAVNELVERMRTLASP